MTQWFYVKEGERLGPVDGEALRAKFDNRELNDDTLLWREGMPQWLTARELAGELGLAGVATETPAETFADAGTGQADTAADDGFAAPYVAASPYAAPTASTVVHATTMPDHEIVYAGFWKRFAAASIDGLVLGAVMVLIIMIGVVAVGGFGAMNSNAFASELAQGTLGVSFILLVYVLPLVAQAIYYTWMHASASQATLGKMAVGIKVARSDGGALTVSRSLGRWAAYFFLSLVTCNLALLVSAIMSGVTLRKQGLHDLMVDSLVVDKWAFTGHPERQQRELGTVTWVVIVLACLAIVAYVGLIVFSVAMGVAAGSHA